MTRARDIMHPGATCVQESESLAKAAQRMLDLNIGFLPICGADDRLKGIITDRDIVVKCIAKGLDPKTTTAGQLAAGTPVTVPASADVSSVLDTMQQNKIRRLPVIDDQRLVGVISEADLATHLADEQVGHFVEVVCSAP